MADLNGLDKVNIRVQNLDKPGQDGFGGTEYTIVNGVNTISIKEKGLVYVMYHKMIMKMPLKSLCILHRVR